MRKFSLFLAVALVPVLMAGCSTEGNEITYKFHASIPNRDPYELTDTFEYEDEMFAYLDENKFSYDLAKLATLSIYEEDKAEVSGKGTYKPVKGGNVFGRLGFKDNERVYLKAEDYDEDKFDLTDYFVAHKEFTYELTKYQVFTISIQGSKTVEDYISNFDIGIDNPNYMIKDNIHKEWLHKENHKGYDVTTTRVLKKFDAYIEKHKDKEAKQIVFISGHSRGAAVANLLGKEFTDRKIKTFAYSIASPTNTQDKSNADYKNLFVLANRDDVVPFLPPIDFGFSTYGVRYEFKMDDYPEVWKKMCPNFDFIHVNVETFEDTILDVFKNREFAYSIPEDYSMLECKSFETKQEADEEHDKFANLFEKGTIEYVHTKVSPVEKSLLGDYRFYLTSAPAFVFDIVTKVMANLKNSNGIILDSLPFITRYIPKLLPVIAECIDPEIATKFVLPHVGEGYLVFIKAMEENDLAK